LTVAGKGVTADRWSNPAINPPGLFGGDIEQPIFLRAAASASSVEIFSL
jgi:hypothetical protein